MLGWHDGIVLTSGVSDPGSIPFLGTRDGSGGHCMEATKE